MVPTASKNSAQFNLNLAVPGVVSFKNREKTDTLKGVFLQHDVAILREVDDACVEIPQRVLSEFSPEARIFPSITSQRQANVLDSLLSHSSPGKHIEGKMESKAAPRRASLSTRLRSAF